MNNTSDVYIGTNTYPRHIIEHATFNNIPLQIQNVCRAILPCDGASVKLSYRYSTVKNENLKGARQ